MYPANTSEWGLHFLNDYHSYEALPGRAWDTAILTDRAGSGGGRDRRNTPVASAATIMLRWSRLSWHVDDKGISTDMLCPQPSDMPVSDEGMDWVNLHVCQRMKAKRILRDMSQERLAGALGISYQQLQRYESGKSRLPCSMLYRAALALDVPVAYFFEALLPDHTGSAEPGLDKATLLAVRNIQSLPGGGMRQSLLNLIADLARAPQTGKRA